MKVLLFAALLPFAAHAQPGDDLFADPCASASSGVPLQNIQRDDVQVVTYGVGTDDVPSSSGHCVRQVALMDNAEFLLQKSHQGSWFIAEPKTGDVLHPDSLASGIAAGRLRWGKSTLPICRQGYGAQHDGKGWHLVEPRAWERSIVRITTPEGNYLVAMSVQFRTPDGSIEVRGRSVVREGTALSVF